MSGAGKSGTRFSTGHRDRTAGDFWSRRKAAVQAEEVAETRAEEAAAQLEREATLAEKSDEDILEELGLPDPETLSEGDDFKVFLTQAVPARIRQRALRKLWLTNPVLANVDGLVDYGEDFTDANLAVEAIQTTYQVGKGMLRHIEEMARQAEAEQQENDAEIDPQMVEDQGPQDAPLDPDPAPVLAMAQDRPVAPAADPDPAPEQDAPRRRMRFAFDDEGPRA